MNLKSSEDSSAVNKAMLSDANNNKHLLWSKETDEEFQIGNKLISSDE